jgi:DNA-binding winged helix-turn-helix (wHTH) protein
VVEGVVFSRIGPPVCLIGVFSTSVGGPRGWAIQNPPPGARPKRLITVSIESMDGKLVNRRLPAARRRPSILKRPKPVADIGFGPFSLDTSAARLVRDGVEVKLRQQAFQALRVLALHSGQFVDYEHMIAEAWNGTSVSRHTVDVTVGEVRKTLEEFGAWIDHRPRVGYALHVPRSDELIRRGQHFWNLRTREGFEKALECFQHAAAEGTTDFRAFEGQSVCYLMLSSHGMRPPREMCEGFLKAHRRAEALAGLTPELRCNRAHGLHMFERRLAEAESEFQQVLREKPTLGSTYVRMSMLYATLGRLDDALDCIARAHTVTPLMPVLSAADVCVRFWRREFDDAVAIGAKAVELHPYLQLGRAFYAQALEFSGRLDEALAQYQLASVMSPDLPWLRALEGVCLAKSHRDREARTILEALEHRRRSDYVDAYGMAVLRGALGDPDGAFRELERAVEENSAGLYALDVDPKADWFRSDPRFVRLRGRLVGPG